MSHIEEGRLHAYLDGALSDDARAEVERHLAGCERCRSDLEEARRLVGRSREILGRVEPQPAREVPWSEIEARGSSRRSRKPRVPSWGIAWAASIALAFAAGWLTQTRVEPIVAEGERAEEVAGEQPLALAEPPAAATGLRTQAEPAPSAPRDEAQVRAPSAPAEGAAQTAAPEPTAKAEAEPSQMAQRAPAAPGAAALDTARVALDELVVTGEAAERRAEDDSAIQARQPEVGFRRRAEAEARRRAEERAPAAALDPAVLGMHVKAEDSPFFETTVPEAETWLGAPLRTLPELELRRVEVGPGAAVPHGVAGLPAVRLVYMDAAAHEIVLTQQRADAPARDEFPTLIVEPSGQRIYRWRDDTGYRLILQGPLGGDSLRALADRIR